MELSSLTADTFSSSTSQGMLPGEDFYDITNQSAHFTEGTDDDEDESSDGGRFAGVCLSASSILSVSNSLEKQPEKPAESLSNISLNQSINHQMIFGSMAPALPHAALLQSGVYTSPISVTQHASSNAGAGMVLVNTPNGPVLHCGSIQLTQQDLLQIQQQLQQKLLSQAVAITHPSPASSVTFHPTQQYVILGTINPSASSVQLQQSNQGIVNTIEASIPELQPINLPIHNHNSSSDDFSADSSDNTNYPEKSTKTTLAQAPKLVIKRPHPIPETEELVNLEELEKFAKYFKQRRVEMGFTQGDVGAAIGKSFHNDFSQTTISRFEALNLSFKNMCKLKPLLQQWLTETEQKQAQPASNFTSRLSPETTTSAKRRKKRTTIEDKHRDLLEQKFLIDNKPNSEQITKIAEEYNLEKDVVRVWFCNRRQKEKRLQCYQTTLTADGVSIYAPVTNSILPNQGQCDGANLFIANQPPTSIVATIVQPLFPDGKVITSDEVAANEQLSIDMASPKGAALKGFAPPLTYKNVSSSIVSSAGS